MDKKEQWFEWRKIIDHLKSKHQVDTSKAEVEMNLLAQEKNKHWFGVFVTAIWYNLCRIAWLNPKDVLNEVEEEL